MTTGRKSITKRLKNAFIKEKRPVVWMHCASLGEFEQGRPLLELIKKEQPNHALLLTFYSPSGFEIRKEYPTADYVFYLPSDSKRNAQKFLNYTKPNLALFVKYEFWYYYLHQLNRRKIPTVLFSAHFQNSQPFFKFYGGLYRKMLTYYSHIFVQDENSEKLLSQISQANVSVSGDTRFDRAATVLQDPISFSNILNFKQDKKLIVAGSTWREDELFLKKLLGTLTSHQFKLLIVPHEVNAQNIEKALSLFGRDACLWQDADTVLQNKNIAVVDTVGQLSFLYQYADVAWVGGGFGKGIHNIIEPAVYGIPIFFGPNYQRFREAFELISNEGAFAFSKDVHALSTILQNETTIKQMGKKAALYVNQQLGATAKIMTYLDAKCFDKVS